VGGTGQRFSEAASARTSQYPPGVKPNTDEQAPHDAVAEVDESLLDWFLSLAITWRSRSASRGAAVLERLARVAARQH